VGAWEGGEGDVELVSVPPRWLEVIKRTSWMREKEESCAAAWEPKVMGGVVG
jgi:hypothetical protein